ncbi:MAG: HU family DNA-binding protein [Candidatus Hydrogenedentes bacterium]|nr:HU family DNA-binding protein [Candidatus Hydrogenedentota bacterium]
MAEKKQAIPSPKPGDKPLKKTDILKTLSEQTGVTKKDAEAVLNTLVEMAIAWSPVGFTIPGLGKLVVKERPARVARNPKTGETMKVPAKKALRFSPLKVAKEAAAASADAFAKAVKKASKK